MKIGIIKTTLLFSLIQIITLIISSLIDDFIYDYMGLDIDFIFVIIIPTTLIFFWFIFYLKKKYEKLNSWTFLLLGIIISIISTHTYILIAIFYAYLGTYGVNIPWDLLLNGLYSTYVIIIPHLILMSIECFIISLLYNKR